MSELPPGFVLDQSQDTAPLPPGFVLDGAPQATQAAPRTWGQTVGTVIDNVAGAVRNASMVGMIKGAAEGIKSGATLPGDVYSGETPFRLPSETPDLTRVADLAGFAFPITPASRAALVPTVKAAAPIARDAADLGVTLTAGQRTGDAALRSAEDAMMGGAKGAGAQRVAQEATALQQSQIDAARDALEKLAGRGEADLVRTADAGAAATQGVREAATEARQGFKAKYDEAFSGPGEIAPEAFKGMSGRIGDRLAQRAEPVIMDPVLTPFAAKALGELDNISNLKLGVNGQPGVADEVVGVNLRGVDRARQRLTAYYKAAKMNPADARAAGAVIREFDDEIERAVTNGLFNGSDDTLKALQEARAAYSSYQKTFKPQGAGDDVGRAIQKMAERDVTPEEVANYMYGANKLGGTGLSVRLADRLKGIVGEDSAQWSAIRQGAWKRLTDVAEGRTAMGPQKMSERILEFVNGDGKTLAGRLFSPDELAEMTKFANVQKAIASKPGTANYSQSGNRLAGIARDSAAAIAAMLGGASHGFEGAAAGFAAGKGAKAFSDARATSQARRAFSGQEAQPLSLTIRPLLPRPGRAAVPAGESFLDERQRH